MPSKSYQNLFGIPSQNAFTVSSICFNGCKKNTFKIHEDNPQNTCRIPSKYLHNTFRIPSDSLQNTFKIRRGLVPQSV